MSTEHQKMQQITSLLEAEVVQNERVKKFHATELKKTRHPEWKNGYHTGYGLGIDDMKSFLDQLGNIVEESASGQKPD